MNTARLLTDHAVVELAKCIVDSHQRVVGTRLIDGSNVMTDKQVATTLYELPAIVLSHDGATDPTFTFANLAAQQLFEYSWEQFLTLRSRQSAEHDQRSARSEMLARAAKTGYISDYQGIRVSASGKRFEIKQAVIWNVSDDCGSLIGQAAVFDDWKYLQQ